MSDGGDTVRGERMTEEMAEQPDRLRELISRREEIATAVSRVRPERMCGVTILARGSSDHAGTYGRYLLEQATGLPISLAAPSLHTHYGVQAHYDGQVVVAVSQSGQTPEIVTTMRTLCRAGACALAVTNDPSSDLAQAASAVVELGVGDERAVPATKTVTAQMTAFALLASALGTVPFSADELSAVPGWVQRVLDDEAPPQAAARQLADATHLIVVARGFLYGAAMESALKIKETCSLLADGYSSADLRHGPIAAVTEGFPVIAMSVPGPTEADMADLVSMLRARDARVVTIAPGPDADVPLPDGMPETLAPIVAVVRGQQLARALALQLGLNPDAPPGLSKVTVT
jgi:glucosamine--fructose-6-phosphate aminotransferase (isomerizing)